ASRKLCLVEPSNPNAARYAASCISYATSQHLTPCRMTYAQVVGRQVKALAMYVEVAPYEGKRCFNVGYAVAVPYRKKGLAKALLTSSLEEFSGLLAKELAEPGFYVEAVVGVDNEPSKRVAGQFFTEPKETVDGESGLPALHYIKLVE
ncbi:hypothetical protein ACVSML_06665, partial [Pseudomonas aeruginosa]